MDVTDSLLVPVGGGIIAVVWEEVIVELPEHVEGDPTIGGQHVVVRLSEHVLVIVCIETWLTILLPVIPSCGSGSN